MNWSIFTSWVLTNQIMYYFLDFIQQGMWCIGWQNSNKSKDTSNMTLLGGMDSTMWKVIMLAWVYLTSYWLFETRSSSSYLLRSCSNQFTKSKYPRGKSFPKTETIYSVSKLIDWTNEMHCFCTKNMRGIVE